MARRSIEVPREQLSFINPQGEIELQKRPRRASHSPKPEKKSKGPSLYQQAWRYIKAMQQLADGQGTSTLQMVDGGMAIVSQYRGATQVSVIGEEGETYSYEKYPHVSSLPDISPAARKLVYLILNNKLGEKKSKPKKKADPKQPIRTFESAAALPARQVIYRGDTKLVLVENISPDAGLPGIHEPGVDWNQLQKMADIVRQQLGKPSTRR